MTKIVLNQPVAGFNLSAINANFQKIQDEFNKKVLYRQNPVGEPNQMVNSNLDMSGNRILNLSAPVSPNEAARLQDVTNAIANKATAVFTEFTPYGLATSTNVQGAIQNSVDAIDDLQLNAIGWYSVKAYGAVGDGVTDDTIAIKDACTAMNNRGGGTLYFPEGQYVYSSATFTDVYKFKIVGANRKTSTILVTNPSANIFYVSDHSASINSLGFVSTVAATGGTWLLVAGTANQVRDCYFEGDHNAITVTGVVAYLDGLVFANGASNSVRIDMNCGDASPVLANIQMLAQTNGLVPFAGIKLTNCTALSASNLIVLTQNFGLLINPPTGSGVNSCIFVNCWFDTGLYGLYAESQGGGISRLQFIQCWFGDSAQAGIFLNNTTAAIAAGFEFIGCQSAVNGSAAISINGSVQDVTINGGVYAQSSVGIFASHTGSLKVVNAQIGYGAGFSANTGVGISAGNSVTFLTVAHCRIRGNGSGNWSLPSSSVPKYIRENDIEGFTKYGTISVSGSPFNYTTPYTQTIYVAGPQVTQIVVGSVVPFGSDGTVLVEAGDTMQVTYTGSTPPNINFSA